MEEIKYIAHGGLNFYKVPNDRYENCQTRKEYNDIIIEERQNIKPNKDGSIQINSSNFCFNNVDDEIFCGDKAIVIYAIDENKIQCGIYTWKKDNPKQIKGYCLLDEIEITEEINGVKLFKHVKK